jgi:hypothetical protein
MRDETASLRAGHSSSVHTAVVKRLDEVERKVMRIALAKGGSWQSARAAVSDWHSAKRSSIKHMF